MEQRIDIIISTMLGTRGDIESFYPDISPEEIEVVCRFIKRCNECKRWFRIDELNLIHPILDLGMWCDDCEDKYLVYDEGDYWG